MVVYSNLETGCYQILENRSNPQDKIDSQQQTIARHLKYLHHALYNSICAFEINLNHPALFGQQPNKSHAELEKSRP